MKAPSFWYQQSTSLSSFLLSPAAYIYRLVGYLRQWRAHPYHAKIPVICIGNVVAGGSGKTPVALAVAHILLEKGHKPIFVTRGYGGREKGPLQVNPAYHSAKDVGDEALLLARVAPVWIGRDRAAAIRAAEANGSHIILDDGLQNPHIKPTLTFLVMDGETGLGNEKIIPAGPLRETFNDIIRRITAVIVIGKSAEQRWITKINCPLLQANWQPHLPANFPITEKFFAFAGIGRPAKFYETCRQSNLHLVGTQDFGDHHMFSLNDLTQLQRKPNALKPVS